MFNLNQAIADWRQQIIAAGIKNPQVLDELEAHLREQADQLVRSGLTAETALRTAAGRLGEAHALKEEFSKVGGPRFRLQWNAGSGLKLLGVWFVLMGLSGFSFLSLLSLAGPSSNAANVITCLLLCGLQIAIGLGLWRRRNFGRHGALAWAGLYLVVCLVTLRPFGGMIGHSLFGSIHLPGDLTELLGAYAPWQRTLLFTRFADFRRVVDFLSPFLLIWGAWWLTRPPVEKLFRPRAEAAAA